MSNTPDPNRPDHADDDNGGCCPSTDDHDSATDPPGGSVIEVEIVVDAGLDAASVAALPDESRIRRAVRTAARFRRCQCGAVGVRVCGDQAIQAVNRDHLNHDYPTDVISFGYEFDPPSVEGEIVVSCETAAAAAAACVDRRNAAAGDPPSAPPWSTADELLLYVVHGTLHLCGLEDQTASQRGVMRAGELEVLGELGVQGLPDVDFTRRDDSQ